MGSALFRGQKGCFLLTKRENFVFREQIGPFLLTELSATDPAKGSEATLPRIIVRYRGVSHNYRPK